VEKGDTDNNVENVVFGIIDLSSIEPHCVTAKRGSVSLVSIKKNIFFVIIHTFKSKWLLPGVSVPLDPHSGYK
jgi:hypothetical protein